jgi:hypothetical protein
VQQSAYTGETMYIFEMAPSGKEGWRRRRELMIRPSEPTFLSPAREPAEALMSTSKDGRMEKSAKPRAVRKSADSPIADTSKGSKSTRNAPAKGESRTPPPPNARVIKASPVKGTVSRAAARAAARRVSGKS